MLEEENKKYSKIEQIDEKPVLQKIDGRQSEYLLQEVSIFNNRVIWYLEQQQKQEMFVLGASGALWAYILQSDYTKNYSILVLIPIIVSVFFAIKSKMLTQAMQESMSYLAILEEKFELDSNLGWVHYYRSNSSHYKKRWRRAFWASMIAFNILLATIFISGALNKTKKEKNNPLKIQKTFKNDTVTRSKG